MPTPVSRTVTCASSPAISAATSTDPPSGVNLTAFVSRLSTTCLSLSSSAHTTPTSGATSSAIAIRWRAARSRTIARPCSSRSGSESAPTSSSIRPASTFERSRISLISSSRCRPESRMSRTYSVLALVELAEHPLEQHVGEADHGVQRRAQLVRHAGQELRLVAARDLELALALLEGDEQLDVLDRDRALRREGGDELDRALVEGGDPVAPQRDDADHLVGGEHRDAEHRAEAAELLRADAARSRDRRARRGSARCCARARPGRPASLRRGRSGVAARWSRYACDAADREREPVDVAVEHVDLAGVGAAQPDGLAQHRLEHRLELERRAPDDVQHLGRGRLALARLGERALELLDPLVGHIAGDFTEST